MAPKITVIGSMNMDLVTEVERPPKPGETIRGQRFYFHPGGKGANQAVAAARLGADVTMIGCVGDDIFGDQLIDNLRQKNVNTEHIQVIKGKSSGTAQITVKHESNSIIVVPGANNEVSAAYVASLEAVITQSDVVLLQLEIPLSTVMAAAKIAHDHGILVILNPAPFQRLSPELIDLIDYLTPNELEYDDLMKNARSRELAKKLIVTKGKRGAQYFDGERLATVPTYNVEVVDTTGAGDAFNGALAYCLAKNKPLDTAIHFANAVGALSVKRHGAQEGMPTLEEVQLFLRREE
ncbi:ribokinase [Pullulanibacillus camelliae]|uniref:Ribokinase n=1 Tax=Pullulanibacillus camelliae TaxID=1707096 RepID=A0A8J2VKF1_9BACL|nr:ribokinase [Pullulanibacillus camelliae]GGE28158.1 ribokinase [Pullulanibacillus camelliae]